ncbi:hypothetical protein GGS24DRAFT_455879 [Hypoxylon argillaceum]|nr:hypothetical protein GGS24DRAFT_455879 [Hypoxylon argillaceum]
MPLNSGLLEVGVLLRFLHASFISEVLPIRIIGTAQDYSYWQYLHRPTLRSPRVNLEKLLVVLQDYSSQASRWNP